MFRASASILVSMAKTASKPAKVKKPSRIKQMWQVFQMTRRYDKQITWMLVVALVAPVVVAVVLAIVFNSGVFGWILWVVTGLLLGVLLMLIILGRRAEAAAYQQIEGQPGAVSAVIKSALRRSWVGSEIPVAVAPKTQDAVYRVVGRGGIVLIAEGPQARVQRLLSEEDRKVRRMLPYVPVTHVYVGPDEDSTPLHKISSKLVKIKPALSKREVLVVSKRLTSVQANPIGIPKGIDPKKIRAQRPR